MYIAEQTDIDTVIDASMYTAYGAALLYYAEPPTALHGIHVGPQQFIILAIGTLCMVALLVDIIYHFAQSRTIIFL